jgi:hypothetical protein
MDEISNIATDDATVHELLGTCDFSRISLRSAHHYARDKEDGKIIIFETEKQNMLIYLLPTSQIFD